MLYMCSIKLHKYIFYVFKHKHMKCISKRLVFVCMLSNCLHQLDFEVISIQHKLMDGNEKLSFIWSHLIHCPGTSKLNVNSMNKKWEKERKKLAT